MKNQESNQSPQTLINTTVKLKPQVGGWLIAYILFSIPGFLISCLVLVLVVVLTLGGLAAISSNNGKNQAPQDLLEYEYVDGNKDAKSKILVYNLEGPILSGGASASLSDLQANIYVDKINSDFKKIKADSSIKAVLFKTNTPGGEVIAAEEIADSINDLMLFKNQPKTVFYWDSVVASGGVFITVKSNNNYVVANPYGESGSIGVITRIPDLQGLYDKIGVKWRVYKSAVSKDYGSEARNPTDDENKFIQDGIDKTFNHFVDLVATGRNLDRNKVLSFANGYVFQNNESKNLGLIDELGTYSQSYKKLAEFSKLSENSYQVVSLKKQEDFWGNILPASAKTNLISNLLGVNFESAGNTLEKFNPKSNMYLLDPRFLN
jgi:protease-4